ncbi:hypothetical protein BH11PSE3_BH11PSE3_25480 [soil metagenome]
MTWANFEATRCQSFDRGFRMRLLLVLMVLSLSACAGAYHTPSDGRLQTRINDAYAARDACLARNATGEGTMGANAATVAQAVALACTAETDKLVDVSNRDGDPKVAIAIRRDSEFRARGFVAKARSQASN